MLHPAATEVEISVPQTNFFGHRGVVGDWKRRRLGLGEDQDLACEDLDFSGGQLRVDGVGRAPLHDASDTDHVLRPQPLRDGHQRVVVADDQLRQPGPVADVDEGDAAQIANAMHPSEQNHVCADVAGAQLAAGMGASEVA